MRSSCSCLGNDHLHAALSIIRELCGKQNWNMLTGSRDILVTEGPTNRQTDSGKNIIPWQNGRPWIVVIGKFIPQQCLFGLFLGPITHKGVVIIYSHYLHACIMKHRNAEISTPTTWLWAWCPAYLTQASLVCLHLPYHHLCPYNPVWKFLAAIRGFAAFSGDFQ